MNKNSDYRTDVELWMWWNACLQATNILIWKKSEWLISKTWTLKEKRRKETSYSPLLIIMSLSVL